MRTVTKTFLKRLEAQKEEANIAKLDKLASEIDEQIKKQAVREDADDYTYSQYDLDKDVTDALWSAAIRIQDYYGKVLDAQQVNEIIESHAAELIESLRMKTGRLIGIYEPSVPGEIPEKTVIEIEDHD